MQPEFSIPDFIRNNSAEEIHQRMMSSLPEDIDDMPGGFPYDFTMPAALEKDEIINYHLVRALMVAFPQYAWNEWLDLHGRQVHLERHPPKSASGKVQVSGTPGAMIAAGVVFCTPATESGPSIEFRSLEAAEIGEDGTAIIPVAAVESGIASNVASGTVSLMAKPDRNVTEVTNPEPIRGGTERESDDDYYDRITAEYASSLTYLGNDSDYIRWAKEAGAGDCIVVPAAEGPGTVKLVLVDGNGQPANEELVEEVYNYIVSPEDRRARRLPTACARLICRPAATVTMDFVVTGLLYDETTTIERIKEDFAAAVKAVYTSAKQQDVLRYNDVRPILSHIAGVMDFDEFFVNGEMKNIRLELEEYPETGRLDFS
ncbi:MAG: baseplate J/gp47 family protein [Lachnospiraceae bacterium]|nr:baseplate J/gp47 family protein [Lachnospiraceae bacterium]